MLHGKSARNPLGWTKQELWATILQLKRDFPEMPGIGYYGSDPGVLAAPGRPAKFDCHPWTPGCRFSDNATLELIRYASQLSLELFPDPPLVLEQPSAKMDDAIASPLPHEQGGSNSHSLPLPHEPGGSKSSSTTATNNSVAYFSWYSFTGPEPSASPGRAYTNLAMNGNLTFLQRSYEQLGVPGMLLLQESRWGRSGHGGVVHGVFGEGGGLSAGWEALVDDCIATLTPLAKKNGGHIFGVQLGDELVCGGFPLSNLSALSARLHDGLHAHGVMIFTNECFAVGNVCSSDKDCKSSGAGSGVCVLDPAKWVVPNDPAFGGCQAAVWPEIPRGLDAISADVYWTEIGDYCPPGKHCPPGNGTTEAAWARKYYEKYFLPLLKPHQSVWMLPGLFGPNGTHGNPAAMAATDTDLVAKLSAYWAWADTEPRVTGCIPWHWGDLDSKFRPAPMRWGGDSYPKTLAWISAKVAQLPPPAQMTATWT
jgi:hypothetical protein